MRFEVVKRIKEVKKKAYSKWDAPHFNAGVEWLGRWLLLHTLLERAHKNPADPRRLLATTSAKRVDHALSMPPPPHPVLSAPIHEPIHRIRTHISVQVAPRRVLLRRPVLDGWRTSLSPTTLA